MQRVARGLAAVCAAALCSWTPVFAGPWDFDGQSELTKARIEAFLNRAVVHFDTASFRSFNLTEWQRTKQFLLDTGSRFVHGAELSWGRSYPDHSYWDQCAARFADLHATPGLEDVMLEGFIAEHISSNADNTLIPAWLWDEMETQGINATRTPSPSDHDGLHYFHYNNFFTVEWPHVNYWGTGASVPDITQTETKLYYRYLLREYIDAGIESIWFGGILLTGVQDGNNNALHELIQYARTYAAQHARRHAVIFTSHTAGRAHDGQELLDYACFPSRVRYTQAFPFGLEINPTLPDTGDLAGILESPSDLPLLLEIDNYACTPTPPIAKPGYDEITGFANKAPADRRAFLEHYYYAVRDWQNVWCNRRVYLAMPGRRNICTGTCVDAANSNPSIPYPAGHYSPYTEHCGDEATIAGLFNGTIPPPASTPEKAKPGMTPLAPPGTWLDERFDTYNDGNLAGQGGWTQNPGRATAIVQSAFVAEPGKAIRLDPFSAGVSVDNKLTIAGQTGGLRRIRMDLAYVDHRPPGSPSPGTLMRLGFRAAVPNVDFVPGGTLFFLYWGAPTRLVYRGNQSAAILPEPQPGRWYHLELILDLDALEADVMLDGANVLSNVPLRSCELHSLGSIGLTGFLTSVNATTYVDNLTGVDCNSSAPYAGQDCDSDGIPDQCEDDADGDSIIDHCDTCPLLVNPEQTDTDDDGVGDPCDNCPNVGNPDQLNTDGDSEGDACDADDDDDSVLDPADNCPLVPNAAQTDRDDDSYGDACDACPDTIPGVTVDASGCTPLVAADYNRDGDVDLGDFAFLQRCFSGDAVTYSPGCGPADLDHDNDVDAADFTRFLPCLTGPGLLANPGCLP